MRAYWVFWTFIGNYANKPIRVLAETPVKACEQATIFDPYKASSTGQRMRFIVFAEGGALVWDGELPNKE